jgi:DNA-binding transcriptional ArsR family regulator
MAQDDAVLDDVFAALADPSRRQILRRLSAGEATVGEVAAPLRMTAPSVSKHVKSLERAGLIRRRVEGRTHWLSLDPVGFREAVDYLRDYERFWEASLGRLQRLVGELPDGEQR